MCRFNCSRKGRPQKNMPPTRRSRQPAVRCVAVNSQNNQPLSGIEYRHDDDVDAHSLGEEETAITIASLGSQNPQQHHRHAGLCTGSVIWHRSMVDSFQVLSGVELRQVPSDGIEHRGNARIFSNFARNSTDGLIVQRTDVLVQRRQDNSTFKSREVGIPRQVDSCQSRKLPVQQF